MTQVLSTNIENKLPWWTWVAPIFIFHLGTQLSLLAKVNPGTALFYFPAPFAIILLYWWGPRVLPAYYLNAALSAGLWGLERVELWFLYAAPEVVFVFSSWIFFVKICRGKAWLPDVRNTALFLVLGIALPIVIYKFILESLFVWAGDVPYDRFWITFGGTSLGDFISNFGVTVPILYFFSNTMGKQGLALEPPNLKNQPFIVWNEFRSPAPLVELISIVASLGVLSFTITFSNFWFVYGVISLYVAIRWGFGMVTLINSYILFLTYLLPSVLNKQFIQSITNENEVIKVLLGSALLYVFSTITGRVISDVVVARKELNLKNLELEQTTKELDRFVYSASHDLSAPLKSIQGLITISNLDDSLEQKKEYLKMIGQSVSKLDHFIKEILDYSRNKRTELNNEEINLKELCEDVIENLKYMDNFQTMDFDLTNLDKLHVKADRLRLKMIFNNLLSNAIKFQNRTGHIIPKTRIFTEMANHEVQKILIKDNGEGIKPELINKVFDMFFRGNERTQGSGLGLYIAREAAEKMGGKIYVESAYGKGTTFILELPYKKQ